MANPYSISRPADKAAYYMADRGGRGAQAHRILQNICRADPLPDSISLVGERRFGKTSLLLYLHSTARGVPDLYIAYMDMLSLELPGPEHFYIMLTKSLVEAGCLSSGCSPLTYHDFRDLLRKLHGLGRRLVLLIDEFDRVAQSRNFNLSFFDNLRSTATTLSLEKRGKD